MCLLTSLIIRVPALAQTDEAKVEVRGKQIHVSGLPFLVKGVHYGPWRPGTGPGKSYPYPDAAAIEQDLRLIREVHANTILVYEPPAYVLDVAHKLGLKVIYAFYVPWWSLGTQETHALKRKVVNTVRELHWKPALLAWLVGNEVPNWVLDKHGAKPVEAFLQDLYLSIKTVDREHPITHSNWPTAKDLNLEFLDVISFNVYPLWPPQVVAMGMGAYIQEVLQPIAGNKPLLITEFGANSLEAGAAGQARLIKESWAALKQAGAAGGVVFEFADEWWKNYDNPRTGRDWWDRTQSPDDEKQHDEDPEEHYGVVNSQRQPKLALAAVRGIFSDEAARQPAAAPVGPMLIITSIVVIAAGAWVWAKAKNRSSSREEEIHSVSITGR